MSLPIDLDALKATADPLGAEVLLTTVGADAKPHVVSAVPAWDGGRIVLGAGRRTAANVGVHPGVTLLWPEPHEGAYRLIVDGDATLDGDTVVITPTFAILHRIADAAGDGPTCLPVGD